VIVYDNEDGGSVVSAINPMAALGVVDNAALLDVAEQVTQKMLRAVDSLTA
jgi:hypothetical protein